MIAIRNYNDTRSELKIAQNRLDLLLDKREALFTQYCGTTSSLKDVVVQSGGNNDKMTAYVQKLHDPDPKTGKSLAQEIEDQQNEVNRLIYYIGLMDNTLKEIQSIEYKLYYAIVVEGRSITSAVDHVACTEGKDTSTIWKNYYPKIEFEIKKLQKVM